MRSLILILSMMLCITTSVYGGQKKDTIKSFEKLRSQVKIGTNYREFRELLGDCKTELKILEHEIKNPSKNSFYSKLKKCLGDYELALFCWDMHIDVGGDAPKSDECIQKSFHEAERELDKAYKYLK